MYNCTIAEKGKINKLKQVKAVVRKHQNYPSRIINAGMKKASKTLIDVLHTEQNVSETSRLSFVSGFNSNSNNVI